MKPVRVTTFGARRRARSRRARRRARRRVRLSRLPAESPPTAPPAPAAPLSPPRRSAMSLSASGTSCAAPSRICTSSRARVRVVLREEAVRLADGAGSAGAPDAVHVVLRLQREVVDEHERDAGNVQPARGDVRGDQHGRFAFAEQIQGVLALGLVFVAVHGAGAAQAARFDFAIHEIAPALGAAEHDASRAVHDVLL